MLPIYTITWRDLSNFIGLLCFTQNKIAPMGFEQYGRCGIVFC